jgi:hypothetical protein
MIARAAVVAGVLMSAAPLVVPAQSTPPAVIVRGDSIEVTFTPLALSETGCSEIDSVGRFAGQRRLFWSASMTFPDSHYPANHFMDAYVDLYFPAATVLTRQLVDSALRAQQITVEEAKGEPAILGGEFPPERSRAELAGSQVHFSIKGKTAAAAFLRPRADSVELIWCQRGQVTSSLTVPLQRR